MNKCTIKLTVDQQNIYKYYKYSLKKNNNNHNSSNRQHWLVELKYNMCIIE